MKNIELVVFDLAGTTVYDDGSINIAFQHAMKHYGYHVPKQDIDSLMGYHKPLAIRMMLEKYEPEKAKISDDFIADIHDRFQQEMIHFYETSLTVCALPYVEETFSHFQHKGIQIGLNTGFSRKIADTIMNQLGWIDSGLANWLVASNEVPEGRPTPFMIQHLMKQAGVTDPKKVVKVGDTEVDILEGRNAGCLLSIAVTTGAYTRDALVEYDPDYILDGLDELVTVLESDDR